jgi:hypothetical protein
VVRSRFIPSDVGEVEILGDQETAGSLRRPPDIVVSGADQMFDANSVDVVAKIAERGKESFREVLV